MNDSALLHAVRRMDGEALAKVFDLYATAIYKYALRHCGNAILADQIVGDVFEKLLERLSEGNGPSSNLRSYLFEMAYHAIVDEVRYSRRTAPIGAAQSVHLAGKAADITVEEQTLLDTVLLAVRQNLTDDQRHVVILRFLEDFSLKETALIMGKTVGNIKVIQNRAVNALRKAMDEQPVKHTLMQQDFYARQAF